MGHADDTQPNRQPVPSHVAVVIDGLDTWAARQGAAVAVATRATTQSLRSLAELAVQRGVRAVTVLAGDAAAARALESAAGEIADATGWCRSHGIRPGLAGDRSGLVSPAVRALSWATPARESPGLLLSFALSGDGRSDIVTAVRAVVAAMQAEPVPAAVDEADLKRHLLLGGLPDPDLFIRTAGSRRVEGAPIWHLAYTELYFTETLGPDFDADGLDQALRAYASRQRRFGRTGEQLATQDAGESDPAYDG